MEIKYSFFKTQVCEIFLDEEDRKNKKPTILTLHHYDKESFSSVLAKGRVEIVTMCYIPNYLKIATRFFVFVKYPGCKEFEFVKTYRASERAKFAIGGTR